MKPQTNQPTPNSNAAGTPPAQPGNRWFERRWVLAVFGVVALGLAYLFASWAIDAGSLLDYALAVLLTFVGLRDLYMAVRGHKKTSTEAGQSTDGKPTSQA